VAEADVRHIDRKVITGRWLTAAPAGEIVIGEGLAKKLEVAVGEAVVAVTQSADGSMGNELYTVVGLASTGSTTMDEAGAWVHVADLQRLLVLEGRLHEVAVLTSSDETGAVEALGAAVSGALPAGVSVRRWWEVDPTVAEMMNMQTFSSSIIIGLFQGVAALGVINTLLMSVSERTRELGVLLAVGLRPRQVIGMVVTESLLLGLLGTAGGLVIGGLLDWYLVAVGLDLAVNGEGFSSAGMQFDPIIRARVTVGSVVQPVIGVFVFATLASLWPAWRASRLDPIQAIRQE
jgi:ABC-type lipoprotein release transport system permease subunit